MKDVILRRYARDSMAFLLWKKTLLFTLYCTDKAAPAS